MITLFSGIPGSGKSYKMVAELSRLKNEYFVVHNIEFMPEHRDYLGEFGVDFVEYCKIQNIEVVEFLSKEYQIEYSKAVNEKYNRPVLVIVDEAYEWFSRHSKSLGTWLAYHRHLDENIWLVTHRSSNLPAVYRSFIEVEYRAKSGSILGFPGYFIYNRILGDQKAGYNIERKKKEIFGLYKSILIDNKKKRKIPMMLPILGVLACIGLILFFIIPSKVMGRNVKKDIKNKMAIESQNNEAQNKAIIELQKIQYLNSIEEKYAFVGSMNGKAVIENRLTGEQQSLERLPEVMKLVEIKGLDSCLLFSKNGQLVSLFNSRRFVSAIRRTTNEGGAIAENNPLKFPANSSIN